MPALRAPKIRSCAPGHSSSTRLVQVPKTCVKSVRRLCTDVLAEIDLRWSWTVCWDRNISRASS